MESSQMQVKVFLWVVPRSISTAFTKFMSFVDGVEVWHEAYVAAFLNKTTFNPEFMKDDPRMMEFRQLWAQRQPEMDELLKSAQKGNLINQSEFRYAWLKKQLDAAPSEGYKHVFCKDHPFAVVDEHEYVPIQNFQHTFLIRHPTKVFLSIKNMVVENTYPGQNPDNYDLFKDFPNPNFYEVFKDIYDLWKKLRGMGKKTVIIETGDLVKNPDQILSRYFQEVGLEWREEYLKWNADQNAVSKWKASFEITAANAHTSVFSRAFGSSSFEMSNTNPKQTGRASLTPEIQQCVEYSLPFYQEMVENRLQV